MLDKLITYIVCWYKTLYQVLPVAWTIRITTVMLVHNRLDLIQSLVPTDYVCNGYLKSNNNTQVLASLLFDFK